jgi:hypothetical protein
VLLTVVWMTLHPRPCSPLWGGASLCATERAARRRARPARSSPRRFRSAPFAWARLPLRDLAAVLLCGSLPFWLPARSGPALVGPAPRLPRRRRIAPRAARRLSACFRTTLESAAPSRVRLRAAILLCGSLLPSAIRVEIPRGVAVLSRSSSPRRPAPRCDFAAILVIGPAAAPARATLAHVRRPECAPSTPDAHSVAVRHHTGGLVQCSTARRVAHPGAPQRRRFVRRPASRLLCALPGTDALSRAPPARARLPRRTPAPRPLADLCFLSLISTPLRRRSKPCDLRLRAALPRLSTLFP